MTRTYDMAIRAAAANQTAEGIAAATEHLLSSGPASAITLQAIAEGSGVTVQTVLRHMGSRDGCVEAVRERVRVRIEAQRGQADPGDVLSAISGLVAHYEAEGLLVLNLLAQESAEDAISREAVESGRTYHRAWVERSFGPLLNDPEQQTIDALVVATDLYVWKLLRLDLGRTVQETEAVITRLVRTLLEAS